MASNYYIGGCIMERKLFVIVFIVLFVSCVSNPGISDNLKFSEIVEVNGVTSNDLFTRINLWMVDAFNNAESVIQYSDKESGIIKGSYIFTYSQPLTFAQIPIRSTITVEVRDGRYKISFDSPHRYIPSGAYSGTQPLYYQDEADKTLESWKNLAESLKGSIQKKSNDW